MRRATAAIVARPSRLRVPAKEINYSNASVGLHFYEFHAAWVEAVRAAGYPVTNTEFDRSCDVNALFATCEKNYKIGWAILGPEGKGAPNIDVFWPADPKCTTPR